MRSGSNTLKDQDRWSGRPIGSIAASGAALVLPLIASFTVATVVGAVLPHASTLPGELLWWLAVLLVSGTAFVLAERAARKLLPLAALLKMTMVFPDHAPSRLSVARRASSTRDLERRVDEKEDLGFGKPVSVATDILALAAALNGHDRRTRGHAERVRAFTDMIAEELRLPAADRDRLRWSALLHDIGKLTVHADILNKAGTPTEQEWDELRRHPLEGARLIRPLAAWLGEWSLTVEQHHERYDGLGYPYGLTAGDLSLGGRIVAVADAFDVMTSARSYKKPMSAPAARVELTKGAGTQFDPAIVRAFLNISIGRLRWAMGPFSCLAEVPLLSRFVTFGHVFAVALPAALGLGAVALGGLAASAFPHHRTDPPTASSGHVAGTPMRTPMATRLVTASPGDGLAVVSWTSPSNRGSAIRSYTVTASGAGVARSPVAFSSAATRETMSGLVNGTSYTFSVTATNAIGTGPPSGQSTAVTPMGPPTAPLGVSASPGNGMAVVTWTAPSDEGSPITSYTITANAAGVAQSPVAFASSARTETMSGLVNGTSCTFSVKATNAIGTGPASGRSNPATPRGPPLAPRAVSASPDNGSAVVTWTAPSDEGSPITSYTITAYAGGVAQSPVAFSSAATTETMSGLVNGTSYTFSVTATNAIGTGPASGQSSPVTPQGAPTAPRGISASPGAGMAVVTWTAPSNKGSPITSYTITAYAGGAAQSPVAFSSAATTETMSGLVNGTSYTFSVTATNAIGTGPPSGHSPAVTPEGPPAAPSSVSASPGNGMAVVTWTAPSNEGRPITSYTITAYAGGVAQSPVAFSSAATTETMSGLVNGTSYTFSVTATNAIGTGPPSTRSSAVTPEGAPVAPGAVSASPGNGSAVVSWTAPSSDGGSPITSYTITAYAAGVAESPVTFASPATTETMSGLVNGTSYTFSLSATNALGTGPASGQSNAVTPQSPPASPNGVSASPGNGSAVVTWTAPFSDGGGPITSYTITAYAAGVAESPVTFASPATTETMSGLVNGTSYTFSVKASNAVGAGPASGLSPAVIPQGPPTAPSGVSASPGDGSAIVSWTAPSSDGGSPITSYTITAYAAGVAESPVTFPSPATTETMSGLVNGTSYTFSVKATNGIGTGAPSGQSNPVTPTSNQGLLTIKNGGVPGRADQGDSIIITFSMPPTPSAFCSTWTTSTHSDLHGPNVIVVGTQASTGNDSLTVTDSDCPGGFHFGSIDLGQRGYFNGRVTFGGSLNQCTLDAAECSRIHWNGNSTLTVTLGLESSGDPTNGTPIVAVYTPDPLLGVIGTINSLKEVQF